MLRTKNFLQAYGKLPSDNGRVHMTKSVMFEDALVSSPLFREHRLSLRRQLIYFIGDASWMEIEYLIVKDHIPILKLQVSAFRLTYGDRSIDGNLYVPGTADNPSWLVIYTKGKSLQDQVDDVTACLEPLLKSFDQPYRKRDTHVPVPQEYREAMARMCMIRMQTDRIWSPTLYGASLGLIDGDQIQDDGQPCHTFFIPLERKAELDRALAWPGACREEESQAVLSLEQRLKKARQGLPSSNASAIAPVRAFGALRLADCLAPFPKYAEKLRQRFGELGTFQEAADRIFQVCVSGDMSHPAMKDCMDLMLDLMVPILDTCTMKDINLGFLNLGKPIKPARPSSDIHVIETINTLMRLPFPSLLMGAAMASGQPGLLQNTQFILDDVLEGQADKLQTSCWTLANYPLRTHILTHSATNPEKQQNFNMLFHLFIQPFALLNRSAALQPEEQSEPVHSL